MSENGEVHYLLTDHLGSTALTVDTNGNKVAEMRYKPWGETRYTWGTTPTDYRYTGQRSEMDSIGLMYYNARWYDPALGRFAQADTIIPVGVQGIQAWDRYAYVNNNPINYSDPSGNFVFGLFVGVTIGGAVIGGVANAYNQYKNTGEVNWNDVTGAALTGAVIGGGAVIVGVAAVAVGAGVVTAVTASTAASTVAGVVAADGDPTNEWVALQYAGRNFANSIVADGDPTNEVTAIVPYYPPNNGFQGTTGTTTLQAGTLLDRYGSTYGQYLAPANTPLMQRALPYGTESAPYNMYQVVKPINDVAVGKIAPWFGKTGGGIQYYLGVWRNVQDLLDSGHLENIIR